ADTAANDNTGKDSFGRFSTAKRYPALYGRRVSISTSAAFKVSAVCVPYSLRRRSPWQGASGLERVLPLIHSPRSPCVHAECALPPTKSPKGVVGLPQGCCAPLVGVMTLADVSR